MNYIVIHGIVLHTIFKYPQKLRKHHKPVIPVTISYAESRPRYEYKYVRNNYTMTFAENHTLFAKKQLKRDSYDQFQKHKHNILKS